MGGGGPRDSALAARAAVTAEDLAGLPLFCSGQGWEKDIPRWCGEKMDALRLEGSFRLSYNASLFVQEGLGYLLTLERLIDTGPESGLVFWPLSPRLTCGIYLVWRRHPAFSPAAERLLAQLRSSFGGA